MGSIEGIYREQCGKGTIRFSGKGGIALTGDEVSAALTRIATVCAMALLDCIAAWLHLHIFDPHYLRNGDYRQDE